MYQEEKSVLAERMTELRKKHNFTQEDIAKYLDCNRATVANYENGKRQPDYNTLIKLSRKYSVSTDYLLGLTDVTTTDKDLKFICDYTGLSEDLFEYLLNEKKIFDAVDNSSEKRIDNTTTSTLNDMFSDDTMAFDFMNLCYCIYNYKKSFSYTEKKCKDILERGIKNTDDIRKILPLRDEADLNKFRCTQAFEQLLNNYCLNEEKALSKAMETFFDWCKSFVEVCEEENLKPLLEIIAKLDRVNLGIFYRGLEQDISKAGEFYWRA